MSTAVLEFLRPNGDVFAKWVDLIVKSKAHSVRVEPVILWSLEGHGVTPR
jgi:hypothetical protein